MRTKLLGITTLLCTLVSFSQSFTINNIKLTVTSVNPNTVSVTTGSGADGNLVIPATVLDNGINYTVTTIGDAAFLEKGLTHVSIPESVTTIGELAFADNQLTSVTIPESVITIESEAFADNQLTSLTIPESMTSIGVNVFANNKLTSVTIPKSVTSISFRAFFDNLLTEVVAQGKTPSTILPDTFGDRSLIDLIIPSGTTDAYIAAGWTGFKSIIYKRRCYFKHKSIRIKDRRTISYKQRSFKYYASRNY
mgnify:CR=1 FL=1